ncbi:transmembrane protein 6/97 [Mycena sp. CBHHK59/15]|nr:transmembrane protein 6/97 [Mycena sp. CBHHK59/15]
MAPKPLTARPLDFLYFSFFLIHIPASLCMDFQPLYPPALVPRFLVQLSDFYIRTSNDPFIKGAYGLGADPLVWFKTFVFLELVFQLPTFFLAARGLWNGSQKIYVLMLVYAASTATTVLPCVTTILATPPPSPAALAQGIATLSPDQRAMLLASYVPFFVVPLLMAVDMAFRVSGLVGDALAARVATKIK